MQTPHPLVLVTGGTGGTGRRVVQRLEQRHVPTRVASRTGASRFVWEEQTTWAAAVDGADAAYLCFSPDLAVPGAAEVVARFAEVATTAGERRLALLSGRGEPGAQQAERLVQGVCEEAGAEWTVVRSAWFAQNFSESFLADQVRTGRVEVPVDDVEEPFVDVDDVADVAVAALTEPGHDRRVYEVTGPRLMTFAQAVAEVATAAGRPVVMTSSTLEEQDRALAAAGASEDVRWLMDHLFREVLDGRNAVLAHGVDEALGPRARDSSVHLSAAAAAGAWETRTGR